MAQSTALLRIGTRGSPLALVQARTVRARLAAAMGVDEEAIELVIIRTSGDAIQDRPLAEEGGKCLFTKEIEEALLDRRVDLAVHSLKDMETSLPGPLDIVCVLPRDDPRDVLVTRDGAGLAKLPPGARIGTASLRRKAQLLRRRPDLAAVPIRGNVDTRLDKLAAGEVDGLLLALCGLQRLGRTVVASDIMSVETMLPAVGQGALAIEARADDAELRQMLIPLHDAASAACVTAERAMLAALDANPARWDLSSLRRIGSSGTVWSMENKHGLLRHLPHCQIFDSLGSSEAVGMGASASGAGASSATALIRSSDDGGFRAMKPTDAARPA